MCLMLDEADGFMTEPPDDDIAITEQIEHMRRLLKRPPVRDRELTMPFMRWWWCWLHMRYQRPTMEFRNDDGKMISCHNGIRVAKFFTERESRYRKEYERDHGRCRHEKENGQDEFIHR